MKEYKSRKKQQWSTRSWRRKTLFGERKTDDAEDEGEDGSEDGGDVDGEVDGNVVKDITRMWSDWTKGKIWFDVIWRLNHEKVVTCQ